MSVQTPTELGAAVRDVRTSRGMSQTQLAECAEVTREWVGRLEKGYPRLEIEKVLRTITALGLTVEKPQVTPTAEDYEKADSLAWSMGLESQNLTPESYERLVQRIATRRARRSA